eukprot:TRINITY_DN50742_c0_g1_i1.p1 TRINITY_DN50742_c0_g1~~TRINITY_DN50742_c0_g1_i1.p1  ORF type:complete len:506 (+),score=65.65 TRINITY_DN50742_c0_g1_i1:84-1601(+)
MSILLFLHVSLSWMPLCLSQSPQSTAANPFQYKDFSNDLRWDFVEQDFHALKGAYLRWSPDIADFDSYHGNDLTSKPDLVHIASADGRPKFKSCQVEAEEGVWHVNRVGPFRSRGGYDWWEIAWADAFHLSSLIEKGPPSITAHYIGMVDDSGNAIGYPPIHNHHTQTTQGAWTTDCDMVRCTLFGHNCCDPSNAIGFLGDFVLPDSEGGANISFGCDYGGYAKEFYSSAWLNAVLNDVRPPGSEPIDWWYQVAVRVKRPSGSVRPPALSVHLVYNDGLITIASKLGAIVFVSTPVKEDSFHYHTMRWQFSGTGVEMHTHSHHINAQELLLFAGSPQQLGLEDLPWEVGQAKLTKGAVAGASFDEPAAGANNRALLEHVFRSMERSQKQLGHGSKAPHLVCWATLRRTNIGGHLFDRRGVFHNCTHNFPFSKGDQWTTLALNGNPEWDAAKYHNSIPQHQVWTLTYRHSDGKSHYSTGIGSSDPDATNTVVTWSDFVRIGAQLSS